MGFAQAFGLFALGCVAGSAGLGSYLKWKLQSLDYCRTFMRGFADAYGRHVSRVPRGEHTVDCWLCGWTTVAPRPMVSDELLGEVRRYKGDA